MNVSSTALSATDVAYRLRTAALTAALLLVTGGVATAGPARARLSADLNAMLTTDAIASVDVIVSGTPARISLIARRHGLRV